MSVALAFEDHASVHAEAQAQLDALGGADADEGRVDQRQVVKEYVRYCIKQVRALDLYNVNVEKPKGFSTGFKVLPRTEFVASLVTNLMIIFKKTGRLPRLLETDRFTDKMIIYKHFGYVAKRGAEDRLLSDRFMGDVAKSLLCKTVRPFISANASVPENNDVPPGDYFFRANFGGGLETRTRFPCDAAERDRLITLAATWMREPDQAPVGTWWKNNQKKRLYLEEDVTNGGDIPSWKFLVVHGKVALIYVLFDRETDAKISVLDNDYSHLDMRLNHFEQGPAIGPPECSDDMKKIAADLGQNHEFVRVGLYLVDGQIHFGELTPVPNAAMVPIQSDALDHLLSDRWENHGFMKFRPKDRPINPYKPGRKGSRPSAYQ